MGVALVLILGLSVPVVIPLKAHAANQLQNRSLALSSSAVGTISTGNPGEGTNGQKAKHTVTFTFGTSAATDGSILIMYCKSPIPQSTCDTPEGLTTANLTSVTVTSPNSTLATPGDYALDTTTTNGALSSSTTGVCNGGSGVATRENCVALKRTSAASETGTPQVKIVYGGASGNYVTNPDATNTLCVASSNNCPFYARIFVFSDTAYTTQVDYGGVAASTAQQISVLAKVQEILNFSVGKTPTPRVGSACTPFNDDGSITLGDTNSVLSTLQAFDNHTYFRINSNTVNGTKVYYSGDTLRSGSNTIDAMGTGGPPPTTAVQSSPGTEQFGLSIDQDDTQSGAGYSFTDMTKTAPYDTGHGNIDGTTNPQALFAYSTGSLTSPVEIASSTGGISCDTGSVRYVANISTSTPAGIYTTTITFIATGTY